MNVMPIGGKSPSDTLLGVAVDANGNAKTKKVWENNMTLIYEMGDNLPESTATIWLDELDISDCAAVSLRVYTTSDAEYSIGIGTDTSSTTYALRNIDGDGQSVKIPTGNTKSKYISITPDDLPILQWIRKLHLLIVPQSVPTTGNLKIWAVTKK